MGPIAKENLRLQVSPYYSWLNFVFGQGGGAVGAFATHIDDVLGCGEQDVSARIRVPPRHRCGGMKAQEYSFAHVCIELFQEGDLSVELTQVEFTKDRQPPEASPELLATHRPPPAPEAIQFRQ